MDLHRLVSGFDGAAEVYERGRPGYPDHVARAIADAAGGPRLLDVGAGTGKLSAPLLALGRDVVAVEPLASMRAVLARAIGPERVHDGRAEALPIDDASVDGAVCSDAWHWFDGERAAAELARVVRPGGGVVISQLVPIERGETPRSQIMRELLLPLRSEAAHPMAGPHPSADGPLDWAPPGLDGPGFAPVRRREDLHFVHRTDRERVVAQAASISFVGVLPPDRRRAVLAELDARLAAAGVERVDVPYRASLWITRRLPG